VPPRGKNVQEPSGHDINSQLVEIHKKQIAPVFQAYYEGGDAPDGVEQYGSDCR
jgi:hypothetical protein